MITIDFTDAIVRQTEKPTGTFRISQGSDLERWDAAYALANDRHMAILQASHVERLLKSLRKGSPTCVDVQRFFEETKNELATLAERYAQRARKHACELSRLR